MTQPGLLLLGLLLVSSTPALAWDEGDKNAYLQKLRLMKTLVEAAANKGEMRQTCLAMSIGNDITHRYLELNPNDREERQRYEMMRNQLSLCLAAIYKNKEQKN